MTSNYSISRQAVLELITYYKRQAADLIRAAKLNGDIKNIHKYCAAIGISTAQYYDVVRFNHSHIDSAEKAIQIIDNIEKIQRGEIKIPRTIRKEEPRKE